MDNMKLYNAARVVPPEAKKPISAGRLKGFTDINPMWRIKRLTEMFGPCGVGWWYEIVDKRIVQDELTNQYAAFMDIELFFVDPESGAVSQPIPGTGGNTFVAQERNGPYMSDECFKMALTDALSVATKSLGIGADVYYEKDRSKYTSSEAPSVAEKNSSSSPGAAPSRQVEENTFSLPNLPNNPRFCVKCDRLLEPYIGSDGKTVSVDKHIKGSVAKFQKVYCLECIKKLTSAPEEEAME